LHVKADGALKAVNRLSIVLTAVRLDIDLLGRSKGALEALCRTPTKVLPKHLRVSDIRIHPFIKKPLLNLISKVWSKSRHTLQG
jgi:hypothetical protein